MKVKIFPVLIVIIFSIIFFIFYKGLQNSKIYIPKSEFKKDIPNFKAEIFNSSKKINSEEIFKKNKFYLMNIWASWCAPCRDEHPFLMSLNNQENIEMIGLNYKDDIEKAKIFLNKFGNPYEEIFSDTDGTLAIEWGAYGVPETFLIYDKKIIKKITGPLNENLLLEIKKLIR